MKKIDFTKITNQEISDAVVELKRKLAQLKLGRARSESKDTSVFLKTRKSIAQYLTELSKRKG